MAINQHVYLFMFLFIALNVFNTFFLTKEKLNRYIAPCSQSWGGEITSILGNVAILVIFILIGNFIFFYAYNLLIYLVLISFILNMLCIILSVYNQYYGTAFSKAGLEMFKNPAGGIIKGLPLEFFKELIFYYRIILFLPTLVLLVYLFKLDFTSLSNLPNTSDAFNIILLLICIAILIIQKMIFERRFVKGIAIQSVKTTYCIQNLGVYPYYLSPFSIFSYQKKVEKILGIKTKEDLYHQYNRINKNQELYYNVLDQKAYSRTLKQEQLSKSIHLDESLPKDTLNGLLKGKKLVLVQIESFNHFLLELDLLQDEHPFLNMFLKECVVFDQFYTSVGVGVSSDAEVSTLSGLYPSGTSNLYWQHYNIYQRKYEIKTNLTTLPKYFKIQGYQTGAVHGDQGKFYNRKQAYQHILEFDEFHALEDFKDIMVAKVTPTMTLYASEYLRRKHLSPWVNDYELAKYVATKIKTVSKQMIFAVTMMPHTPFEFNPEPNRLAFPLHNGINAITERYLNFTHYYDQFIRRYFLDQFDHNVTDQDTVYLFYGDHGSGLKNDDLSQILHQSLSNEQERRHLLHVPCFMYVPGKDINSDGLYKGLITGHQPLVRGQIDIYRSIIDLFGLEVKQDFYMGVHLFSEEPTFVMDNKLLDIVTDQGLFSMRNPLKRYPLSYQVEATIYQHIRTLKLLNDLLYKDANLQTKVNEFLHQNNQEV